MAQRECKYEGEDESKRRVVFCARKESKANERSRRRERRHGRSSGILLPQHPPSPSDPRAPNAACKRAPRCGGHANQSRDSGSNRDIAFSCEERESDGSPVVAAPTAHFFRVCVCLCLCVGVVCPPCLSAEVPPGRPCKLASVQCSERIILICVPGAQFRNGACPRVHSSAYLISCTSSPKSGFDRCQVESPSLCRGERTEGPPRRLGWSAVRQRLSSNHDVILVTTGGSVSEVLSPVRSSRGGGRVFAVERCAKRNRQNCPTFVGVRSTTTSLRVSVSIGSALLRSFINVINLPSLFNFLTGMLSSARNS